MLRREELSSGEQWLELFKAVLALEDSKIKSNRIDRGPTSLIIIIEKPGGELCAKWKNAS